MQNPDDNNPEDWLRKVHTLTIGSSSSKSEDDDTAESSSSSVLKKDKKAQKAMASYAMALEKFSENTSIGFDAFVDLLAKCGLEGDLHSSENVALQGDDPKVRREM